MNSKKPTEAKEGTEAKGIGKPIIPRGSEPNAERQNSGTMPAKSAPSETSVLTNAEFEPILRMAGYWEKDWHIEPKAKGWDVANKLICLTEARVLEKKNAEIDALKKRIADLEYTAGTDREEGWIEGEQEHRSELEKKDTRIRELEQENSKLRMENTLARRTIEDLTGTNNRTSIR